MKAFYASPFAFVLLLSNPLWAREKVPAPLAQPHNTFEVIEAESHNSSELIKGESHDRAQVIQGQNRPEVSDAPAQETAPADEEANTVEIRSIQAIHQANLTWIAAHFIAVARLDSVAGKQEAWEEIQDLIRVEGRLIRLAAEYEILLAASHKNLLNMQDANEQLLDDLRRAPTAEFDAYFAATISAARGDLLAFLQTESQQGLVLTEVKDLIDEVIQDLEQDEGNDAS